MGGEKDRERRRQRITRIICVLIVSVILVLYTPMTSAAPLSHYLQAYAWIYGRPFGFFDRRNGNIYLRVMADDGWTYAPVIGKDGKPQKLRGWKEMRIQK